MRRPAGLSAIKMVSAAVRLLALVACGFQREAACRSAGIPAAGSAQAARARFDSPHPAYLYNDRALGQQQDVQQPPEATEPLHAAPPFALAASSIDQIADRASASEMRGSRMPPREIGGWQGQPIDGAGSRDFPHASHRPASARRRRRQESETLAGAAPDGAAGGPRMTAGFRVPGPGSESGLHGLVIFSPDGSTHRAAVSLSRPSSAGGTNALVRLVSRVASLLRSQGLSLQHNLPQDYVDALTGEEQEVAGQDAQEELAGARAEETEEAERSAQYLAGMLQSLFANNASDQDRHSGADARRQTGTAPRNPVSNLRRSGIIPYERSRWSAEDGTNVGLGAGNVRACQHSRRSLPSAPSSYYRQRVEPLLLGRGAAGDDGGDEVRSSSWMSHSSDEELEWGQEEESVADEEFPSSRHADGMFERPGLAS